MTTVTASTLVLRAIVGESRDVAEYARRVEAWAATEAKPPTDLKLARVWLTARRVSRGRPLLGERDLIDFIERARAHRILSTDERYRALIADAPSAQKRKGGK